MKYKGNYKGGYSKFDRLRYAADDLRQIANEVNRLTLGEEDDELNSIKHAILEAADKLIARARRMTDNSSFR